jgi:hypothetical protein
MNGRTADNCRIHINLLNGLFSDIWKRGEEDILLSLSTKFMNNLDHSIDWYLVSESLKTYPTLQYGK